MTRKKIIALLVCLAFVCTMLLPSGITLAGSATQNGLVMNKTATKNQDGTYTINLEAWATGRVETTTQTTNVPADIVLVLDQSGSMDQNMITGYQYTQLEKKNEKYYDNRNNLYYLDNEEYKKVTVQRERKWRWWNSYYQYTYTFADNTTLQSDNPDGNPGFDGYRRTETKGKRLNVLKSTLNSFLDSVQANAVASGVEHRIAMVGFASESGHGNNTELFNGSEQIQYKHNPASPTVAQYQNSLKSITTQRATLNASVNALAAEGATRTDLGMEMAYNVLKNNPVPAGQTRSQVVIVFTDGEPTTSNTFDNTVANNALAYSKNIKAGTGITSSAGLNPTVYTIGIFDGANGNPLSQQSSPGNANKFMHYLSSNYPNAQSMSNPGSAASNGYYLSAGTADQLSDIFQSISSQINNSVSNSTLSTTAQMTDIISPYFDLSYDLGAGPADAVKVYTANCIGMSGGTPTWDTLQEATGVTVNAANRTDDTNPTISVSGFDYSGNWVGLDENNRPCGQKLVVQIQVKPRPGFLGGNGVVTNYDNGGLNGAAIKNDGVTAISVTSPTVDVPIAQPTITAPDYNVYLNGSVDSDTLKAGLDISAAGSDINPEQGDNNYGLQTWQNAYVNIETTLPAGNGPLTADTTYTAGITISPKTTGDATETSANTTGNIHVFKPEVTFSDVTGWYGDTMPALTHTSEQAAQYNSALQWYHGEDTNKQYSTTESITMTGDAPVLTYNCELAEGKVTDGKISTKDDFGVNVTVSMPDPTSSDPDATTDISGYTTFLHACSVEGCAWSTLTDGNTTVNGEANRYPFACHVNTCTLTIHKVLRGTNAPTDEYFVFDIKKGEQPYTSAVIKGNGTFVLKELPVGEYIVTEQSGTSWSWRYTVSGNGEKKTLSSGTPNGSVTITNTYSNDSWLGDEAGAINAYGDTTVNKADTAASRSPIGKLADGFANMARSISNLFGN